MTQRAEHPELPTSSQSAGKTTSQPAMKPASHPVKKSVAKPDLTVTDDDSLSIGPPELAEHDVEKAKAIGLYINSIETQMVQKIDDEIVSESSTLDPESPDRMSVDPIPPAVLIPRFSGEPLHADLFWPPRPRGTGEHWPPEARVESKQMPGRFPIGYAWHMAAIGMPWTWDFEENASIVHASDAIAEVVATLIGHPTDARSRSGSSSRATSVPTCLVVPNHLNERAQQNLIDTIKNRRLPVSMLPRPIAAAMTWCDRFNDTLREDRKHDPLKVDVPVGSIVTLHLGLDHWEAAFVDVIARRSRKEVVYLPARRRKCIQPLPSYGLELMHRLAIRSLEMSYQQMKADRVWELIWCTPWMKTALAMLSGEKSASFPKIIQLAKHARKPEFLVQQCRQATQRIFRHGETVPALLRQCQGKTPQFTDIRDWFTAISKLAKNENLLGAVVTGPMTMIPQERDTVANHYLRKIWPNATNVLIGGLNDSSTASDAKRPANGKANGPANGMGDRSAGRGLSSMGGPNIVAESNAIGVSRDVLAHAAADHAHWIAKREENNSAAVLPTYVESIPRVRIGANVSGKPSWVDLFENYGQYIPGGVSIQRPYPLAGLPIKPHTDAFKIAIDHEDLPTIHLASAHLPQPVEQPEPVNLHVTFQPGHGFPTVELIPEHEGLFGRHRVFVDFRSLTDTEKTADEFLASMRGKSKGERSKAKSQTT